MWMLVSADIQAIPVFYFILFYPFFLFFLFSHRLLEFFRAAYRSSHPVVRRPVHIGWCSVCSLSAIFFRIFYRYRTDD